jgi:hypothetical protein
MTHHSSIDSDSDGLFEDVDSSNGIAHAINSVPVGVEEQSEVDVELERSKFWINDFFPIFFTEEFVEAAHNFLPTHFSYNELYLQYVAAERSSTSPSDINLSTYMFSSVGVNEGTADLKNLILLKQDVVFVLKLPQYTVVVKLSFQDRLILIYNSSILRNYAIATIRQQVATFTESILPDACLACTTEFVRVLVPWPIHVWEIVIKKPFSLQPRDTTMKMMQGLMRYAFPKLQQGSVSESESISNFVNAQQAYHACQYACDCHISYDNHRLKCLDCSALPFLAKDSTWWFLDCKCRQRHHIKCHNSPLIDHTLVSDKCSKCLGTAEYIFVGVCSLQCCGLKISSVVGLRMHEILGSALSVLESCDAARKSWVTQNRQLSLLTDQPPQGAIAVESVQNANCSHILLDAPPSGGIQAQAKPPHPKNIDQAVSQPGPPVDVEDLVLHSSPEMRMLSDANILLRQELILVKQRLTAVEQRLAQMPLTGAGEQHGQMPSGTSNKWPKVGDNNQFLLSLVKWRQSQAENPLKEDLLSNYVAQVEACLQAGGDYHFCASTMGETASRSQYLGGKNKNNAGCDYYRDKVLSKLRHPGQFLRKTRNSIEGEPYIVLIGLLLIDLFDQASATFVQNFISLSPKVSVEWQSPYHTPFSPPLSPTLIFFPFWLYRSLAKIVCFPPM